MSQCRGFTALTDEAQQTYRQVPYQPTGRMMHPERVASQVRQRPDVTSVQSADSTRSDPFETTLAGVHAYKAA